MGGTCLVLRVIKQSTKRGWMAKEPGRGYLQRGSERFEQRDRGIELFRFNLIQYMR